MAEYITREELRSYAAEMGTVETARVRKAATSRSLAGSTFLSRSSKDDDLVARAIRVTLANTMNIRSSGT